MSELKVKVDFDRWTMGDMEDFADIAGMTFERAIRLQPVKDDDGKVQHDTKGKVVKSVDLTPKALTAILFIEHRKVDPEFTLASARNTPSNDVTLDFSAMAPKATPSKRTARKRSAPSRSSATTGA